MDEYSPHRRRVSVTYAAEDRRRAQRWAFLKRTAKVLQNTAPSTPRMPNIASAPRIVNAAPSTPRGPNLRNNRQKLMERFVRHPIYAYHRW